MAVTKFKLPIPPPNNENNPAALAGAVAPGIIPAGPADAVAPGMAPAEPAELIGPATLTGANESAEPANDMVVPMPLSFLVPYSYQENYAIDEEELNKLVDSIRRHGVLEPIQVKPLEDGNYMIISGHRRVLASRILGLPSIPAIIKDVNVDTANIIFYATNLFNREEYSPLEKAQGYKVLMDDVLNKDSSIRKQFSDADISYRMVKRYISLLDLIPLLQKMVDDSLIGVSAGSELSRLPADKQEILYQYIGEKGDKFKINEKQANALCMVSNPDFKASILEVLEPKKKEKISVQQHIKKVMTENDISIPEEELFQIITIAIMAYKEREGKGEKE